jgi:hypothetical protein
MHRVDHPQIAQILAVGDRAIRGEAAAAIGRCAAGVARIPSPEHTPKVVIFRIGVICEICGCFVRVIQQNPRNRVASDVGQATR